MANATEPVSLLGKDLIAQAKTGSGKTAAFGIALLANLNARRFAVQAMVLCPTRELADQKLARADREGHTVLLAMRPGNLTRSAECGADLAANRHPGRCYKPTQPIAKPLHKLDLPK